jgi:NAD(P)H-dependent FMN reductase
MKPKILAFAGSSRKDSFNKKLIRIAVEGAKEAGADVTLIDLGDFPMPIYDGDYEDALGMPDKAKELKKLFLEHRGLLIASPEYNSSFSGLIKNCIDWISRPVPNEPYLIAFKDKIAALFSASPGALGGLRGLVHLRAMLGNIGVMTLPGQVCISTADKAFDEAGKLLDSQQEKKTKELAASLSTLLATTQK